MVQVIAAHPAAGQCLERQHSSECCGPKVAQSCTWEDYLCISPAVEHLLALEQGCRDVLRLLGSGRALLQPPAQAMNRVGGRLLAATCCPVSSVSRVLLHPVCDSWNGLHAPSCFPCGTDLEICDVVLIRYWLLKETHDLWTSILKATCKIRYCLEEEGFASIQELLYKEKPLLGFCLFLAKIPHRIYAPQCIFSKSCEGESWGRVTF